MSLSRPVDREDTQPRRIRDLFSQRNLGTVYLSTTLELLCWLSQLGLKPREDGWRKFAAAFLRSEDSRFTLAVFRLNTPATDQGQEADGELKRQIVVRLARFFQDHPQLWATRLEWTRRAARIPPNGHLDMVWAEFDAQGNLSHIQPCFDADRGLACDDAPPFHAEAFIRAYNETRLAGRQRPYHLMATANILLKDAPDAEAGLAFARRMLDSVFVEFEESAPGRRFDLPDFSVHPHPGGGAFHILCRLQPDRQEVDLWFHVNHVLQDGKPVLETFDDLKRTWGVRGATVLPPPARRADDHTLIQPAHNDSGRELVYVQRVLAFEALLEARRELNARCGHLLEEDITVAGMILWGLCQQPFLADAKITIAVDVSADAATGQPRTLGYVTSKPGDFRREGNREGGFITFQNHLNRAIARVRQRRDLTHAAMRGQALMPVESYEMTLATVPQAVRDIGGQMSLTIMPAADYCAAPADDSRDALIAVGNFMLPTESGERGGVVSIKAIKRDARRYGEAIFNAVTQWRI